MPYAVGKTLRLKATITDEDTGEPITPATVVFEVMAPNATTPFLPTVLTDGPGSYHAIFQVDSPGKWSYRVDTTNPNDGEERDFTVNPTRFPGG